MTPINENKNINKNGAYQNRYLIVITADGHDDYLRKRTQASQKSLLFELELLDIALPSGMDLFYQKEKGKSENSKY